MRIVKIIFVLLLAGAAFVGGYFYRPTRAGKGERKILYWVDPMHPAYKSDKPGIAPDCGMKLEPVYADGGGPAQPAPAERKVLYYRDPQNHAYTADKPGLNPETGNDWSRSMRTTLRPCRRAPCGSRPEKQQLIGVKFGTAEVTGGRASSARSARWRSTRRASRTCTRRIEGWVEKVFVGLHGRPGGEGPAAAHPLQPRDAGLAAGVAAGRQGARTSCGTTRAHRRDQSDTLFEAARRRLELWDLSEAQIEQVLETGEPIATSRCTRPRPASSSSATRSRTRRSRRTATSTRIADLSRVWIMADVFEYEAPNIQMGQPARVTLPTAAARSIDARVDYIQPQVDPMTRTLKVRLDAANPDLLLKPDMFVDVEFRIAMPQRLTVPAEAVLDTGERKTVSSTAATASSSRGRWRRASAMATASRAQGTEGRRAGRHLRHLPDRFGKPAEGGGGRHDRGAGGGAQA